MKYIDLHADTLMFTSMQGSDSFLTNQVTSIDLERMKAGRVKGQFLAIFMLTEEIFERLNRPIISDQEYIKELVDHLHQIQSQYSDEISLVTDYTSYLTSQKDNKIAIFLTLEDGRPIQNDLKQIEDLYQMGIRLITLTWNHPNCIGYPNSFDSMIMSKGLTEFGKEAVEMMNQLGIIVDVSHLSDGGFWDIVEVSKRPFIASHSNARSLSPHPRNLTDEMIKAIANAGGVIGLNFYGCFLNADVSNADSTIDRMVKHLNHIYQQGGAEVLSIGTDFDGMESKLEIPSPREMPELFHALHKAGWSDDLIESLAYRNVERLLADVLI